MCQRIIRLTVGRPTHTNEADQNRTVRTPPNTNRSGPHTDISSKSVDGRLTPGRSRFCDYDYDSDVEDNRERCGAVKWSSGGAQQASADTPKYPQVRNQSEPRYNNFKISILHTPDGAAEVVIQSKEFPWGERKGCSWKLEYRRICSIRRASVDSMQLLTMDNGGFLQDTIRLGRRA